MFFFLLFTWGSMAKLAGDTLKWCSLTTDWSRSTGLCIMHAKDLSIPLKLAWIDSAPCSPITPKPRCHFLTQGMT